MRIHSGLGATLAFCVACSSSTAPPSDAGRDAEGGAVTPGGDAGPGAGACGGSDFVSCNDIQPDGTGACWEASGFQGTQRQLFEQSCPGTLGTARCPQNASSVGGCKQATTYCWVIWGYEPDDPATGKAEQQQGCAMIGGTYLPP